MVATDSKWISSYDISNPSNTFKEIIENLKAIHIKANFGDVRTSTSSVEKSSDIVELRTGYCEYVESKSGKQVMDMLTTFHRKDKKTIILITHDIELVKYTEKRVFLRDGEIVDIKINHQH